MPAGMPALRVRLCSYLLCDSMGSSRLLGFRLRRPLNVHSVRVVYRLRVFRSRQGPGSGIIGRVRGELTKG